MEEQLIQLKKQFDDAVGSAASVSDIEALEQEYFSRKAGKMTGLMKQMKDMSVEEKKKFGKHLNDVKQTLVQSLEKKRSELEAKEWESRLEKESLDVTQPQLPRKQKGHLHPITTAMHEMSEVARAMGFIVEDGPELDSDYYSFEGLNIPKHHPARDGTDTFYIKDHPDLAMRPHVSNMQGRLLQKYGAPLRAAYPGRVFRNEALDATHGHTFYQFEALVVDRDINIGHLVGIIEELLMGLFGRKVPVRLRPGYFPFVEPGFEMDIQCFMCMGEGCRICKKTGWIEMLGCGLMHPRVIEQAGYDSSEWNGLAFGMGLDRLVMMKYGIEDIRHMHSGDLRFLEQF